MNALIRYVDDQISPHQAVMDVSLVRDVDVHVVQPPPANGEKKMHDISLHIKYFVLKLNTIR